MGIAIGLETLRAVMIHPYREWLSSAGKTRIVRRVRSVRRPGGRVDNPAVASGESFMSFLKSVLLRRTLNRNKSRQ
jgi:hypothetical protein